MKTAAANAVTRIKAAPQAVVHAAATELCAMELTEDSAKTPAVSSMTAHSRLNIDQWWAFEQIFGPSWQIVDR